MARRAPRDRRGGRVPAEAIEAPLVGEGTPYFPNGIILGTGDNDTDEAVNTDDQLDDDIDLRDKVILDGSTEGLPPHVDVPTVVLEGDLGALSPLQVTQSWTTVDSDCFHPGGHYLVEVELDFTGDEVADTSFTSRTTQSIFTGSIPVILNARVRVKAVCAHGVEGDFSSWSNWTSSRLVYEDWLEDGAITEVKIEDDSISTPKLQANSVTASVMAAIVMQAAKYIRSLNYDGTDFDTDDATDGFNIEAEGGAEFANVRARGKFETSASGERAVLDNDSLELYSGHASETSPAQVVGANAGGVARLSLTSPEVSSGDRASLELRAESGSEVSAAIFESERVLFASPTADNVRLLHEPQGGRLRRTTSFSHTNNNNFVTVPVTAGATIAGGMGTYDATNNCWLPPQEWFDYYGTVWLEILCRVTFAAHSGTGLHQVRWQSVDGSGAGSVVSTYNAWMNANPDSSGTLDDVKSGIVIAEVASGEAMRMQVLQNSGGNLNLTYAWDVRFDGGT